MLVMIGQFWVVFLAFNEDTVQGLLVWFLPFYWWVYVISRFDDTWLPLCIAVIGGVAFSAHDAGRDVGRLPGDRSVRGRHRR